MIMSGKTSLHLMVAMTWSPAACVTDESIVGLHLHDGPDVVEDKVVRIVEGAVPRTVWM
jgi:hypothetical protein